jgi:hypothetical protein
MSAPATIRVFIAGMSGAGKSTAAWRLYLSRFPRRILLDLTGEWSDPNRFPAGYPGADYTVATVPELSWAIHKLAPTGRWTIVLELGVEDLPELVDYLLPIPRLELSPIYQCGGAVMLCDEVDLIAPPHTLRQEVRTLYRRSRHIGLSLISTTTRPEAVSREVSAQSTQVLCLSLVEPNALDYMEDLMGRELEIGLPSWTRGNPHGGLWWERATGRTAWLTESGRLVAPAAPAEAEAAGEEEPARAARLRLAPSDVADVAEEPEAPEEP